MLPMNHDDKSMGVILSYPDTYIYGGDYEDRRDEAI